ncbi:hypothetical protein QR680_000113 [Steinernema hermaphroditum]|uniref:RRM domain-containing protein n=1 Tax=Steinernema hermaphroditum TaxID=289476 RepID=A0AA39GTE9_9BILA|nr:hypothetical protein QR680_000113 [Steinernema hermaphroditum]
MADSVTITSQSSTSSTSTSKSIEPDPDTIKMFVGQIPRSWDEDECRKLFEKHGDVYQLNVLRDKSNQTSKGCCFVTYFHRKDAIAAQNALHDIVILPGMHHAVQMKPADSENRNERKLFVGMLSKRTTESEVRSMFDSFGNIEDCTILRGCAFVTYVNRNCAQQAIKQMHQSRTMEGCLKPLVVKFADTQKDKDTKKPALGNAQILQQFTQQPQVGNNVLTNLTSLLLQASTQPQVLSLLGNVLTGLGGQSQQAAPPAAPPAVSPSGLSASGQIAAAAAAAAVAVQSQQSVKIPERETTTNGTATALLPTLANFSSAAPAAGLSAPAAAALHPGAQTPRLFDFLNVPATAAHTGGLPAFDTNSLSFLSATPAVSSSSQTKGPDGANLFIYHLPQEFKDQDLLTTFGNFGTILSAKVFIDKHTNLSKCFGFVSFDNPMDAQRAIQAMNGLQIGNKRLKVQLKRMGDKPYS